MKKNIFDFKMKAVFVFGATYYLALVGCGNNNPIAPPVQPNLNTGAYNGASVLDGTWRLMGFTCNGMTEDQYFYSGTNSIHFTLTGGVGPLTVEEDPPQPTCAASAQLSAISSVQGQVVLKATNAFTLNPAGCSFASDYNQVDFVNDMKNGYTYTMSGAGSMAGGYPNTGYPNTGYPNTGYPNTGYPNTGYPNTGYPNTGYPNTGYPNTGYPNTGYPNTGYPQGGYNTGYNSGPVTLTSTTVLPCKTGGSGYHVLTLSH